MLMKTLRWIDRLFIETSIVTTTTTVKTYRDPADLAAIRQYCRDNNIPMQGYTQSDADSENLCSRCETTIVASETEFVLADRTIPIPDIVRKMAPIDQVDASYYYHFPLEQSTDILVMSEEPNYRFTAHYGVDPKSTDTLLMDNVQIRSVMSDLEDQSANPDYISATANYEIMDITSILSDHGDYLVTQVGSQSRISIAVNHDYDIPVAVRACILARALLITLMKTGKSIADYNEHDLRSIILALLLVDRNTPTD